MKYLLIFCALVLFGAGCINNAAPSLVFTEPKTIYRQLSVYEGQDTLVRGKVQVMPAFCTLRACIMDGCSEGESMECNSCGASALIEDEDSGEQILLEDIACAMNEIWHCGGETSHEFVSCDGGLTPGDRIEVRGIVREQFAGPIHLEQARLVRELEDFE